VQVDEQLRQMAADRQHLQESLARLDALVASYGQEGASATIAAARREADEIRARAQAEASRVLRQAADGADLLQRERLQTTRRELERLTALRLEVAGCLEASIAALHKATGVLTSASETRTIETAPASLLPARVSEAVPPGATAETRMPRRRVFSLFAPAAGATVLAFLAYGALSREAAMPPAPEPPEAGTPQARGQATLDSTSLGAAAGTTIPNPSARDSAAGQSAGLVLTLTARRECWIATNLDGNQNMQRTLKPAETIILYAHDEAVIRLGDAGAVSVLINNQPARPLGADGEVTTQRITRANYSSFLAGSSSPQPQSSAAVPKSDAARVASAF
jgi:hypothetical protein